MLTTVLDPRGTKSAKVHGIHARPRTLEGCRIALFDNLKPNADLVLDRVLTHLSKRHALGDVKRVSKRTPTGPASAEDFAQLRDADVVLLAMGDCGGCTAWTVHDAVELERMGVPTVTFVSGEFIALAEAQSKVRGLDALPIVRLPHPFGQLPREKVEPAVDAVIDTVIGLATAKQREPAPHE